MNYSNNKIMSFKQNTCNGLDITAIFIDIT